MEPMIILALDQATTTGWAVTDGDGHILDSGVWHLEDRKRTGESRGMRYIRFEAFLRQAIEQWKPDIIIHEQTLLLRPTPRRRSGTLRRLPKLRRQPQARAARAQELPHEVVP